MANSLWSAGEPNYHVAGRKACAYTYRDVAKLYDAPCGNQNSYACEKGNYLAATTVDFQYKEEICTF